MLDLATDTGLGKRSHTGKRLDDEWEEIKQRWDERLEENRAKAAQRAALRKNARNKTLAAGEEVVNIDAPADIAHPRFEVVDDQIVVDAESTNVNYNKSAMARADNVDPQNIRSDERIYNYVNQNRIGKKAGLRSRTNWTAELTDKFYQGMGLFGTDFELIAGFFGEPWTRRQIKAKFVREERTNIQKIKDTLRERENVNVGSYEALIEGDLVGLIDPDVLNAELKAEEARIKQEWAKEKAAETFGADEADRPVASIEDRDASAVVEEEVGRASQTPVPSSVRMGAVSKKVAAAKGKRQLQKQREQSSMSRTGGPGRKGTRGKKPLEGVEERIGALGDVDV
jgi:transcription factor TFIIIB component B''